MNGRIPAVRHWNLSRFFPALLLAGLVFGTWPNRATAEVSASVSIWHGYSFFYPSLGLNSTNPPVTFHWMESPGGLLWKQLGSTNGSDGFTTNDLSAVIHECTNGLWKLYLNRGDVSEQLYYFAVSLAGISTNLLGNVQVSFPVDGSSGVTNFPTCVWTGPSHFASLTANTFYEGGGSGNNYGITLPGTATSWTPGLLTAGENSLLVIYFTNNHPGITFTTPTNTAGTPLADWNAQGNLYSYRYSFFDVAGGGSGGHTLQAHYSFENGNIFGTDYSGKGNNISGIASAGGGMRFTTNSPALGSYAAYFDNNGGTGSGWLNAPTNLLATVADSFTLSLWVQTSQISGNDTDAGFGNAGLVSAFTGPGANWILPMAITGDKLAFVTGGSPQNTLRSTLAITNGSGFVHLVVSRNRLSGEKKIYVNGTLNTSTTGSTDLLDSPTEMRIGQNNFTGLQGVLDEIQFYAGVLSDAEVAFLYNNPGSTVPDVISGDSELADAVDAPDLVWITGDDGSWFRQTTETYDGTDAAQSGAIEHNQQSWIETTVEGPGVFSFWWNVSSDDSDGYDYLELTVDSINETEISGEWGWDYYEVYLDSGTHTLRWTYHKDDDFTAGEDAAWLDEAVFVPQIEVGLTLRIERNNDPANPGFYAYPTLDYYSPAPLTSHEVESPTGKFGRFVDGGDNYPIYDTLPTLQGVLDELAAGPWRLYINRGHPSERQYTFTVTVTSFDPTNLPAANVTSPGEWETGIATNHTFTWTGPTDYDALFVYSYLLQSGSQSGGFTNLNASLTGSRMPNALLTGTNAVFINYTFNQHPGVEISDPMDGSFNPLSSWYYQVQLGSVQTRRFEVGGASPPAAPVQILNPRHTGTNFSLSFVTQSGRTHIVQSRTNLSTAPWLDLTNIVGNGNSIQLFLPLGTAPESYFRVGTQ